MSPKEAAFFIEKKIGNQQPSVNSDRMEEIRQDAIDKGFNVA